MFPCFEYVWTGVCNNDDGVDDDDDDDGGAGLCFEHSQISQQESCIQIVFPFLKLEECMSRTTNIYIFLICLISSMVPLLTCIPNVWI